MTSGHAANGDCSLYYDTFGSPSDPTLLLVNGLGGQCIGYEDEWCEMYVAAGFHVVRFDNRDVGLSTKFDDAPKRDDGATYLLSDMAADACAVLDALDVSAAHIAGLSLGGMIVQTMAIQHPSRVLSLTSVMSTTGEAGYGTPTPEALAHLTRPAATSRESYIDGHVAGLRIWGSPEYADEARWRAYGGRAYDRCFHPSGTARQFFAVGPSGSRAEGLRALDVPTLVIHGDKDTLIDQSGGRRTAELVPGARFELVEGMGHDYPPALWPRWVELIAAHALS